MAMHVVQDQDPGLLLSIQEVEVKVDIVGVQVLLC
jgi:hypothetical protein